MMEFLHQFPPGSIMVIGAFFLIFLGKRASAIGALVLSVASLALFWTMPSEYSASLELWEYAEYGSH